MYRQAPSSRRRPPAVLPSKPVSHVGRTNACVTLAHLLLSMLMIGQVDWESGCEGKRKRCAHRTGRTFFVGLQIQHWLPGVSPVRRGLRVLDFRHAPLSGYRSGVPGRAGVDGHSPDLAGCPRQSATAAGSRSPERPAAAVTPGFRSPVNCKRTGPRPWSTSVRCEAVLPGLREIHAIRVRQRHPTARPARTCPPRPVQPLPAPSPRLRL